MLRFSGSSQNPGSSVLDELQLSNGLLWKAGEETITIIHPAGDKGMNKFLQVFLYVVFVLKQTKLKQNNAKPIGILKRRS